MDLTLSANTRYLWPFVWPCVFHVDQLTSASDRSLEPLAMQMRGRQLGRSPRPCTLTLSSRIRNVWTADRYQRAKVTLRQYLEGRTTHICPSQTNSSSAQSCSWKTLVIHNIWVRCEPSVRPTHSRAIFCFLWPRSQSDLSHQLMGEQDSLWWEFDCSGLLSRLKLRRVNPRSISSTTRL